MAQQTAVNRTEQRKCINCPKKFNVLRGAEFYEFCYTCYNMLTDIEMLDIIKMNNEKQKRRND